MATSDDKYDDDSHWNGVEDATDDPEEMRVIFCALDSFG
jgi:carnosine N-methyltransferase